MAIAIALLLLTLCVLPIYPAAMAMYVFLPFQFFRNKIFDTIPFSVGDIIYLAAGVSIGILVIKWVVYVVAFAGRKHALASSLLRTATAACIIYLVFLFGWGINYYKPSLSESWKLDSHITKNDSFYIAFDTFLINRLNIYAPHYKPMSFDEVLNRSVTYYRTCTRHSSMVDGMKVKPSLFGNLLEYMGVQGYYNPFTGEAQVNSNLPDFMLPFVICHELAHQAGVAAEDDANLMAYAVDTKASDSSFNYSAYFNIWLYTHSRVKMMDTALGHSLYKTLNPVSVAHLDILRAISKRYHSKLSKYSSGWYDRYLRMQHVKKGIESYEDVVESAYLWEQGAPGRKDSLIKIP